jgi:hypothetical protein
VKKAVDKPLASAYNDTINTRNRGEREVAWQTGAFREPLMVEMRQLLAGEWTFEGGLNRSDPQ